MITMFLDCCPSAAQIIKRGCDLGATTCDNDVEMARIICMSAVAIAGIVVIGFLLWKLIDHIANGIACYTKRKWEIKDIERKGIVEKLQKELEELKGNK